ncbi:MAG: hypothetical protein A2X86_21995 [Bdellovibrionales bacterium GWA2_49_15]|nr:MAG: hypothetical protein A2X86_21995 [Bdellovibrionales bacterium GWA2_49_15]HAZ15007.1 hypothetical protein [Bdellovibrionales bacterium]
MTQEDHKACRDGVTGMVFFKFKSSLSDTARRRLENEVAQGKRDKSTIHPFANIEKIDCQSIISEHAEIYQKFSSKYSACLYANTLEQFTSIYADDNLDPKIELRKQINDKVYSTFSFERCPSARSSMEGTLYKLRDAKTGLELCETSAVGLQEIGIIFRDQCRQ